MQQEGFSWEYVFTVRRIGVDGKQDAADATGTRDTGIKGATGGRAEAWRGTASESAASVGAMPLHAIIMWRK